MKRINAKIIYRTTFVIIGTIIGAGFASGQEIYTFFNRYGLERTDRNSCINYSNGVYNIQNI